MSAILDALGYVGDALDKPGRAVRGLLGGRPEEALAAVPFSDAMGLTNAANRVSGSDLLRQMGVDAGDGLGGTLAGIGVEMATDPLTWGGAGLGAMLGRRAGAAAMARGPRYETTADDLMRQVDALPPGWQRDAAADRIAGLSKTAPEVFGEIPTGSQFLGVGAEGLAMKTPADDVVRVGMYKAGTPTRPVADTVLPATRTADYGAGPVVGRAERMPLADGVGSQTFWESPAVPGGPERMSALIDRAEREGIDFFDIAPRNVGVANGRSVIIDPGSFDVLPSFAGGYAPLTRAAEPSALMNALIGLGGGDEAVRAAINAGRADPGMMYTLARLGGMGGAGVGAAGRLFGEQL